MNSAANVKTFMDGDRFILVVEQAQKGETAKIIREFVGKLLIDAPAAEIKGLQPHPDPSDKLPFIPEGYGDEVPDEPISEEEAKEYIFTSGEYKGLCFNSATVKYGRSAAIKIYVLTDELPQNVGTVLKGICRNVILNDLNSRNPDEFVRKDVRSFIFSYRPIAEDLLKKMKDSQGCSSIEDFVKFSDNTVLSDAYKTLIKELKLRV